MPSADLDQLLRWEGAGGTWRLLGRDVDGVELELLTCGRDEVMGRLRSAAPDLVAYVDLTPGARLRGR
jgi:hypothetical protein